jgi:2,3-bisphosphoglycerate-independent phosphoglycerate mutase
MKSVVVMVDGLAGGPLEALAGDTALQAARTDALDGMAAEGSTGLVRLPPDEMPWSAEAGVFCLLGLEPARYTGIGPLEALGAGVRFGPRDVAFVAQLVSSDGSRLTDQTAGEVTTEEAHALFETIEEELEETWFRFYPGQRERQILIWSQGPQDLKCVPPEEAEGCSLEECMPQGDGAEVLRRLYWDSLELLDEHPVNRRRRGEGLPAANLIWPWAPGAAPRSSEFTDRPASEPVVVTGSGFVRGAAGVAGANCPRVPSATGWWDTGLRGKLVATGAALSLAGEVLVHVRAPGLPGGTRDVPRLVEFVERMDEELVAPLVGRLERAEEATRIAIVSTTAAAEGPAADASVFVAQPPLYGGEWRAEVFTEEASASTDLAVDGAAQWRRLIER